MKGIVKDRLSTVSASREARTTSYEMKLRSFCLWDLNREENDGDFSERTWQGYAVK